MSKNDALFWTLLVAVALLLADKMGWLPQPGAAVPQVIVVTAVPAPQLVPAANTAVAPGMATAIPYEDWAGAAPTAVPDLVIISPPATWTAVPPATPTPLPPSTGLLAIVARYGETAVQQCMMAMAAGALLDLQCRTIAVELNAVGQGGQ